ncbi:ABC-2 family transporter [Paenibacillus sp. BK033]|uniref:ABC transporter permease n=2 Tax=unclassified Paenibacillus TaxID=185978 RepID=UPI0010480EF4|nr:MULTISPECIES: ABC transporter permease subunit [unclassified Paenibacillus]NIK69919.1 hypothetical protein [Paenibacillus sp. BK720]TCM97753.1 ABC-2 family transporter [Paenibacillus sp. BK033]
MKLFHYEMKKLLVNRNKLILLVVLFVIYTGVAWVSAKGIFELSGSEGEKAVSLYTRLLDGHSGALDREQLASSQGIRDAAVAKYGTGEGLSVRINRDPELKFHVRYAAFGSKVDEYWNGPAEQDQDHIKGIYPLREKLESLEEEKHTATYDYRLYSKELANELAIGEPVFENAIFWNFFFIRFDGFMIVFLLLLVLTYFMAPLFTQEVRTEMDSILLSTVKGRKEIVTAKLLSAGLTAVVITAAYLIGSFIGTWLGYGDLSGFSAPLRSLEGFESSALPFSIGGTVLLGAVWLIASAAAFSMALAFISSKLKGQSSAFGIGMVILLAGSLSNYFSNGIKKLIWPIVDFNYGSLAMVNTIFGEPRYYDLFGFPLSYGLAACLVGCLLATGAVLLTYAAQKRRSVA